MDLSRKGFLSMLGLGMAGVLIPQTKGLEAIRAIDENIIYHEAYKKSYAQAVIDIKKYIENSSYIYTETPVITGDNTVINNAVVLAPDAECGIVIHGRETTVCDSLFKT